MTTRALPMNSSVPPMASCVFIGCEGHGYFPKNDIAVDARADVEVHGQPQFAAHLPERVPRAVRRGRARRGRAGSDVMLTPRAPSAATRLASATHASTPHAGISGSGSKPVVRVGLHLGHRVVVDLDRDPAQRGVLDHAEVLPPEPDGAREDDLRIDPGLVEHAEADVGVVRAPRWTLSMRPLEQRFVRALLGPVAVDHTAARSPGPARARRTPTWVARRSSSTRGTRSRNAAGARFVNRSGGSHQCESASTMNMGRLRVRSPPVAPLSSPRSSVTPPPLPSGRSAVVSCTFSNMRVTLCSAHGDGNG